MRTRVEGCGVVVWFGKYTDIASLVLLFGFTQPAYTSTTGTGIAPPTQNLFLCLGFSSVETKQRSISTIHATYCNTLQPRKTKAKAAAKHTHQLCSKRVHSDVMPTTFLARERVVGVAVPVPVLGGDFHGHFSKSFGQRSATMAMAMAAGGPCTDRTQRADTVQGKQLGA